MQTADELKQSMKRKPIILEDLPLEKKVKENENPDLNNLEAIPWVRKQTLSFKNPSLRLHNEMIDFYNYISPSENEHKFRTAAFERIKQFIIKVLPTADVECFGSFRTKLYLPNADIDLVAIDNTVHSKTMFKKVASELIKNSSLFEQVQLISNAKVPIIKFVEIQSQLNFDLSFNKDDGLRQIGDIEKAFQTYPELKFLIFIIKCVLRQRDLHETYTGGVGSFLLFQMILAFLRQFRKEVVKDKNRQGLSSVLLGEYLLNLLDFYGVKFDFQRKKILMTNGGQIVDKPFPEERFSLISPQDPDHDIGHPSYKIKEIFNIFKNRYNFLTNYNFRNGESVLKYLLNPSNQKFTFLKK